METQIFCFCGKPAASAICKQSETFENIGRGFYTCHRHKDDPKKCKFFRWKNEEGVDTLETIAEIVGMNQKMLKRLLQSLDVDEPLSFSPPSPKKSNKRKAPEKKKENKKHKMEKKVIDVGESDSE